MMRDNMAGLDTFAVGYAAAEAKYKSELEALKRERAMLVEAFDKTLNQLSDACRRLGGSHMQIEFDMLNFDLSATEPQATQCKK